MSPARPGPILLFGSGETSPSGGKVFEAALQLLGARPRLAILETPAGFEPNSAAVAGRVAEFLQKRLQNYQPQTHVVPARKRGTAFSPDDPAIVEPLLHADLIFLGAGSPTYAVRQLWDSLTWQRLLARHCLGGVTVLASAAVIAAGAYALPVYEIYKAGQDPHWRLGLNLLGAYGLNLACVPHWNNAEGGAELDTSYCFMGPERYATLRQQLPAETTCLGLDEHTVLWVDVNTAQAEVMGLGNVTVQRGETETRFASGQRFPLSALGPFAPPPPPERLVPPNVWEEMLVADDQRQAEPIIPPEVLALANERQAARVRKDWPAADALRQQIAALGWNVLDTPAGPRLEPLPA